MHVYQHDIPLLYIGSDRCVSKLLLISSPSPLATSSHHAMQNQYCSNIATGGVERTTCGIWEINECVKIVSVCVSFENNKIKLVVSVKCCVNVANIAILNLH
jgi:hypothetical protein